MHPSQLAIFPLSSHILPSGRLPLRIFEARYIRMIAECSKNQTGFGIAMINSNKQSDLGSISPIATYVKIIDFYHLKDGFLGLIVEGVHRFKIQQIEVEHDGLRRANIDFLPNWPQQPIHHKHQHLTEKLADIFSEHPELDQLYPEGKQMNDSSWIAQRWLELLPISVDQKQQLIIGSNSKLTLDLLTKLMAY